MGEVEEERGKKCRRRGREEREMRSLGRMTGMKVPGTKGYKYFGAAKDLPGVRELFKSEHDLPAAKRRGRGGGSSGAASGCALELPDERSRCWSGLRGRRRERDKDKTTIKVGSGGVGPQSTFPADEQQDKSDAFVAHVAVPSKEELERAALAAKKRQMLAQ
eukprot:754762-Hanusia_phi.AAC.7